MTTTVSVIVPTYNRPDTLPQALASLAAQEGVEVEALVINDAGCDISAIVAQASKNLNVRLINKAVNQGLSAARNTGIEAARGKYMAFLDDDDVFLPQHLRTAVAVLENSGADVAYAACPVADRRIDPATVTQREVDQFPYAFDYPFNSEFLSVMNFITVHSVVMCSLSETSARFDTSLPFCEDWDMWLRLVREYGMQFVHVPMRTVIYHRLPQVSSMTTDSTTASNGPSIFRDVHLLLDQRWPVADGSPAAISRSYRTAVDQLAADQLASGRPLPHFFYERVLKVIYEDFIGVTDHARILDNLTAVVTENDHTQQ